MSNSHPTHVAHCRCGAVELGAWGLPILVAACYCDDCQAASARLGGGAAGPDGGTEFMVFRPDRIACTRGSDRLHALRLTDATRTRRMVAGCCATPMYLAFDEPRPWISAFRANFGAAAPPVRMRVCTRFAPSQDKLRGGVPSHPGYPPAMMLRILAAWPGKLFNRPVGELP